MSALRHWDDEVDATFEHRTARHDRAYRRARVHAARRAAFWDEVVRYCVITCLLLWIIRPIGIIVAICWGFKLWSRYSRLELGPRLRERWTERELERDEELAPRRRQRHGRRRYAPRAPRDPRSEARTLLVRMGDDPNSSANLELAKSALADAEGVGTSGPEDVPAADADEDVYMADVLEQTLANFRERMQDAGVSLSVELDSAGRIRADVNELQEAFTGLLKSALDALADAEPAEPRVEVAMGENLARTQVWVRIRHNGTPLGSRESEEIIFSKNGEEQT
ncbi:MAG: hypothetical protein V3V67_18220 [Myxococcota bacterium]